MRDRERKARQRAKQLRQQMPNAEVILRSFLRRPDVTRMRFRRQHPIGPYIADFACVLLKLVIEIDGVTHCSEEEQAYDARGDAYMQSRGWHVLRFTNVEVYKHLDGVLDVINSYAPPPSRRSRATGEPPPP